MSERAFEVLLGDLPVGHLAEGEDGTVSFRFLESYRRHPRRPILGQRFEDDLQRTYTGKRGKLPPFFENLVPEGKLREVIEERAGIEAGDDLGLLGFVGRDLPGAIVLRPAAGSVEMSHGVPEENGYEEEDDETARLRFSLAGVQMKFSMLMEGRKLTLPARDRYGDWIVKFDSPTFPHLPENEFSMLEWARRSGFEVPEARLHEAADIEGFPKRFAPRGSKVLAVRRFDRQDGRRVHQEDFTQVVGLRPALKYDQLTYEKLLALTRVVVGEDGAQEFVRRLALVVACGNNDAHLKNWSLLYPDGIRAVLSPLYDQVSTVAWEEPGRVLALKLASVKDFGRIDRSAFERLAEKAGVDRRGVINTVTQALDLLRGTWHEVSEDLPLDPSHVTALRKHWQQVPILRDAGAL